VLSACSSSCLLLVSCLFGIWLLSGIFCSKGSQAFDLRYDVGVIYHQRVWQAVCAGSLGNRVLVPSRGPQTACVPQIIGVRDSVHACCVLLCQGVQLRLKPLGWMMMWVQSARRSRKRKRTATQKLSHHRGPLNHCDTPGIILLVPACEVS